jgi:hypothetical protein
VALGDKVRMPAHFLAAGFLAVVFLAGAFLAAGFAVALALDGVFLAGALTAFVPLDLAWAAIWDFLRAALFLWITAFLAALSIALKASRSALAISKGVS